MPIFEDNLLDTLSVRILRPSDGAFVLGHSLLGGSDTMQETDPFYGGTGNTWVDILPSSVRNVSITRGASRDGLSSSADPGTLSFTVLDDLDPDTAWWLKAGLQIVVHKNGSPTTPLFTGLVSGVAASTQVVGGKAHVYTTVSAIDYVAQLANTTRYGAVHTGSTPWETFDQRASRLLTSKPQVITSVLVTSDSTAATASYTYADVYNSAVNPNEGGGTAEMNRWTASNGHDISNFFTPGLGGNVVGSATDISIPATVSPITFTRKITGLTPGRMYWMKFFITASSYMPIRGTLDGTSVLWNPNPYPDNNGMYTMPEIPFIASAATVNMSFTLGAFEDGYESNFSLDYIKLGTYDTEPFWFGDTVEDTSLASHFDRLCNSVPDGGWYISKTGALVIYEKLPNPSASQTFTDGAGSGLHYIGLTRTFDTAAIVNNLTVNNHGRAKQDDGTYADNTVSTPYEDDTSALSWGAVAVTIDTALASTVAVDRLGNLLVSERSAPVTAVTELTWNAQEDLTSAFGLEVYQKINVTYNGVTSPYRVLSITHDMSPSRWMVTLELGNI